MARPIRATRGSWSCRCASRSASSPSSRRGTFPLSMAARKLAPALAAGNGVVFKPSEFTPLMGQRLVEVLLEAGVPANVVALVQGRGPTVGQALTVNADIDALTFTGSYGRRSADPGRALHRHALPARDGRQERHRRPRRRGPCEGGRGDRARRVRAHRAGLHRDEPRPRRPPALRGAGRKACVIRQRDHRRPRHGGRHPDGTARDENAVRQGAVLHRDRKGGRRPDRHRRRRASRHRPRAGARPLRQPRGDRRRPRRQPPPARGDLRPGRRRQGDRYARRGDRPRRRHRIRPFRSRW